jgi:hypothetical protein
MITTSNNNKMIVNSKYDLVEDKNVEYVIGNTSVDNHVAQMVTHVGVNIRFFKQILNPGQLNTLIERSHNPGVLFCEHCGLLDHDTKQCDVKVLPTFDGTGEEPGNVGDCPYCTGQHMMYPCIAIADNPKGVQITLYDGCPMLCEYLGGTYATRRFARYLAGATTSLYQILLFDEHGPRNVSDAEWDNFFKIRGDDTLLLPELRICRPPAWRKVFNCKTRPDLINAVVVWVNSIMPGWQDMVTELMLEEGDAFQLADAVAPPVAVAVHEVDGIEVVDVKDHGVANTLELSRFIQNIPEYKSNTYEFDDYIGDNDDFKVVQDHAEVHGFSYFQQVAGPGLMFVRSVLCTLWLVFAIVVAISAAVETYRFYLVSAEALRFVDKSWFWVYYYGASEVWKRWHISPFWNLEWENSWEWVFSNALSSVVICISNWNPLRFESFTLLEFMWRNNAPTVIELSARNFFLPFTLICLSYIGRYQNIEITWERVRRLRNWKHNTRNGLVSHALKVGTANVSLFKQSIYMPVGWSFIAAMVPTTVFRYKHVVYHHVSASLVAYMSAVALGRNTKLSPDVRINYSTFEMSATQCNVVNMPDMGPEYEAPVFDDGKVIPLSNCRLSTVYFMMDYSRYQAQVMATANIVGRFSHLATPNFLITPVA